MFRSVSVLTGRHLKGAALRRRRTFRKAAHGAVAASASLALVASGMVAGLVGGTAPAQADYATAGSGPYQSRIYWFDMTNFPLNTVGGTQTFSPAPGVSATVTMTAKSAISGTNTGLTAQSLSSYSGSPAGQAYAPAGNVAIANSAAGAKIAATFTFSMTVNGRTITPRVVATDGEATNSRNEALQYNTTGTDWVDFQDYRKGTTMWAGTLSGKQLRITNSEGTQSTPFVFSDTTQVSTRIEGGGTQAAAFGLMLPFDYGDAPASYGIAQHLVPQTASGTAQSTSSPPALNESAAVYLGRVAPDSEARTGATLTTDDTTGAADEGVSQLLANGAGSFPPYSPGQRNYSVQVVCTGPGATVKAWLDTSKNGAFEDNEAATTTCQNGSATLNWSNLPAASGSAPDLVARFRIASAAADVATPAGSAADGEVEDYEVAAPVQTACPAPVNIVNGGFEQPVMTGNFQNYNQSQVPGWRTTASDGLIEYWKNGFNGVPSAEGNQFVEINATQVSALYQDIATTPGQTIRWSLAHRGRQGTDVMKVVTGPPGGTMVQQGPNISDGNTAWGRYSGTYTIPAGQTTTRFQFESVSSTGAASIGNFLDDVTFSNSPCLTAQKSVTNVSGNNPARIGDTLEYSVDVTNAGGSDSPLSVLADQIPTGTTYVPGSLKITAGTGAGNLTDAAGDDRGDYSAAQDQVTVRLGTGATPTAGGTLAPGAKATVTFRVTVNPESADSTVHNVATVSYQDPILNNAVKTSYSNTVSTPVASAADLQITKEQVTQYPLAGQPIEYRLTVKNNGPRPATGVTVQDSLPAAITGGTGQVDGGSACTVSGQNLNCAVGNLAVGATRTITVKGTVAANAVPGSSFTNTATVSGNEYDQVPGNNSSSVTTTLLKPGITVTKSAGAIQDSNGNGRLDAGDTVPYSFVVKNTGDTTLTSVKVTDAKVPNISCPATTLAPNASTTCTGSYVLTQADIDAGKVDNSATATGTPPVGDPITSQPSAVTTPVNAPNSMTITKSAGAVQDKNGNGRTDAGDTIDYSFVVKNTGTTTLNSLALADPKISGVTCPTATLAPGASTTCVKTYTITQADMDAGKIVNQATGTAKGGANSDVNATSNEVTTPLTQSNSFDFTKSAAAPVDANKNGRIDAGDTIGYSFKFTNTGSTTLRNISVADSLVPNVVCSTTTLAPGESVTCTGSYTITQADMDAGKVDNSATGTVTQPDGSTATKTSTTSTPLTGVGSLTFDKQQGTPTDADGKPITGREVGRGDKIPYTFLVTNTGSVTVSSVTVVDSKVSGINCGGVTSLEPGKSVTCSGVYTITQADVDAGAVTNTANANGKDPKVGNVDSANDSTTLPLTQSPKISLTKAAGEITDTNNNGKNDPDDTLAYTFTVKNEGNVTVNTVSVSDGKIANVSCPAGSLAPGESVTCTGAYRLTQADFDAGKVDNEATAKAKSGNTEVNSEKATATKLLPTVDAVTIKKTAGTPVDANENGRTDAGDTISYSFLITNTGNTTLRNITVNDPKVSAVNCPVTSLAAGKSVTCTGTHTITQAEVDAGKAENTATATGTPPGREPITSGESSTTTPIAPVDALTVVKDSTGPVDGNQDGRISAGEKIPYTFTVTNTGSSTLTGVRVADSKVTATCNPNTLAPGASVTCTGEYTLTQADIDAGKVDNTATAFGTPPGGRDEKESGPSTKTVTITQVKSLELVKDVAGLVDNNSNGRTDYGDFIRYTFKLTNTGTVSLDNLVVNDPKASTVTCPSTSLAPGASVTCTATYEINQPDVDAGQVVNKATATANDKSGTAVTSNESTKTVPTSTLAQITLKKTAAAPKDVNNNNQIDAGDTVDYTFEVKNTGDVSISGSTVKDPLLPALTCPAGVLAPGQTKVCRATYTITQADVDAGKIVNTATATGTDPKDNQVTATDSVTVTIPADSNLDIIKTAGEPRLAPGQTQLGAGSLIDYSFKVTNESNVTVTDVAIVDDQITGPISCEKTTLAPNESTTCTATYTLTTQDYDVGFVLNIAEATAKDPAGETVDSWDDSALVELKQESSMTMKKTAGAIEHQDGGDKTRAGDTVKYTFEVKNTGNTTLYLVGVRDSLVGTVKCPVATLAPGASTTCEASYSITQADIDRGTLENKATGVATPPSGDEITSPEDNATVDTKAESALSLTKQAAAPKDANGNGRIDPGDTVDYTFTLTNTGQVTLKDLSVTDNKVASVTCPTGSLAPGASATCTATRVLTQADIDAGKADNSATASSTDSYGATVTSNEATATIAIARQDALTIKKSAGAWNDANGNGMMDPGETIPYSFLVTNTGTTTLTDIKVNDALVAPISCAKTTLAPGESVTCTGSYTLTQAAVDRGNVLNSATATGTTPGGGTTTSPGSEVDTLIPRTAKLFFDKQAGDITHTNGNTRTQAGDTITYTFLVENRGNVSIDFLQVNDPKVGLIDCSKDVLQAGESMTCTKVYTITAADMDLGTVENVASAIGEDPDGNRVDSNSDKTTTGLDPSIELAIKKSAAAPKDVNGNGLTDAGDTIDYSFAVTNNGTVTMSNLKVNDAKLPGEMITCPATSLAAGQTMTCTGTYTITQADVDAGKADNTATATGTPPDSTVAVTSGPSGTSTPIAGSSSLTITKDGTAPKDVNGNGFVDPGDTIDYTFTVTNTGTTTLRDLVINDPLIPSANITCEATQLAPKAVTTCRGTYTITQDDADNGKVVNTATATGKPDQGDPTTSPGAEKETEIPPVDKLEITNSVVPDNGKSYQDANGNGRPDAGEKIAYQFVVKNTGNTTQHEIRVADPKIAGVSCPAADLAAGASMTCTATYPITQADLDAGTVDNTATATGTPPGSRPDTSVDSNEVTTPLDRSNGLSVVKAISSVEDANNNQLTDVPDVVNYTFTVTNNGNTTVKQIRIQDAKVPNVSCTPTELAPGAVANCTGSYTITQADVNDGKVSNTATAVGTGSDGQQTTSDPSTKELKTSAVASMSLAKKVDPNAPKAVKAGDPIAYIFTLTNTGTLTLSDPTVAEQLPGVTVNCPAGPILPGQSIDCTGSYTVTQADVDNGKVTNTATGNATAPVPGSTENQPVSTDQASVDEILTRNNQLDLSKTVKQIITEQPSGRPVAGDQIVYALKATNRGNTTLTDVVITDSKLPGLSCTVASLAPGAELNCEGTYTLTQADADAPTVDNTATAKATGPGGTAVDGGKQSTSTPTSQEAALQIKKSYQPLTDTNGDGVIGAGDKVTFTFVVTNSGTVTLRAVEIDDQLALDGEPVCEATSLAPKASTNCTATYTLTQADVEAGSVRNSATAIAAKPDGGDIESPASEVTVAIDRTPGLAFEKKIAGTKDLNNDGRLAAGDEIDYVFTVKNTGNVKLSGVAVVDRKLADAGVSISCPSTDLDPGQSIDCTATYRISQSDANAGSVKNTAHAEAKQGETPVTSVESSKEQPLTVLDELSVDKKVTKTNDVNGNGKLDAGDTIEYQFLVTNSGTREASGVSVNDPRVKVECPASVVGAGTSMTCTAVYTVTQADVDAGSLQNTATATGSTPDGKPNTSEPDSVTTPLDGAPGVKLLKQAGPVTDANGNGRKDAGDSIVYTFTVTNTGNTTLFGIVVQDEKLAAAGISVDCPVSQLAPGQSTTCTSAPYQVTAADVDAGAVSNVATASVSSGSNGGQKLTSDPASVKTGLDPKPTPPTPPVEPLPNTGVSNLWIIGLGALIIVIGAILLFLGARRRRRN